MIIEAVGFEHPHVLDKLVEVTKDLPFAKIMIFVWKDSQSINAEKKSTPFLTITVPDESSAEEIYLVREILRSCGYLTYILVKPSESIPIRYR
ncbi:MAG: hypothetical protein COU71_01515 [Parcubacteria group bacterium CG10_big_fil_rev_8_21_14_0_10_38_31]|nr:MAG: hypothetical protein COU71_01515 [Parcubacteria group bacterium CG10_big_fil_rev_8_21_14_0_10_38_31]